MLTSKFALSLLFYITIALTISSSHASMDSMDMNRRHGNINRMIRMRSPAEKSDLGIIGGGGGGGGGAGGGNGGAGSSTTTTSAAQQTTSNPPANTSTTKSNAGGGGLLPTPSSQSTTSSSSSSTTSSSSSQSTSSSSSSTTTSAAAQTTLNVTGLPSASFGGNSVTRVFVTSTDTSTAPSTTPSAAPSSATSHTTITVLIVIAAVVGGIAVIWTIIRKWKFRPSSQFEDRMQPIDWQPTNGEDAGIPGHRRMGSNASSFLSGSGHHGDNMAGRGQAGYGATSDHGHGGLAPLPDHDFTAGAAHFAPVGGYADLSRGMPEQPPMQEYNRYDHYGVSQPQHQAYDAYDYNAGAY